MKHIFAIALSLFIGGCASKRVDPKVDARRLATRETFERGVQELDKENYAAAAKIFDGLIVENPATEFDLIAIYNSGSAQEGLGNCERAADRYRQLVRSSAGKFQRIEAMALFRASLMYECLGQDVKAVTSLLDVRKRRAHLPPETIEAEIPARLSAAYSRLGNRKRALYYLTLASRGLKKIVAQEHGAKQLNLLGQTLYLMGKLNEGQRRAEGDGLIYLQGISFQQPYLLQAAELDHEKWTELAAADLEQAYQNIWKFKYSSESDQEKYYTRAIQLTRELRQLRMPNKVSIELTRLFASVDKIESQLQVELTRLGARTKLTPEAQSQQAIKKKGRLVDPKSGR